MPYKDPEKERACGRRRYERITAERIARGMCPRCGKAKPAPDRTLCRHCGEKRRKAERARCAKAKAAGILYGGRDPERWPRVCARQEQAARSGHGGTLARARAVAHIHPLKAARCANRATWHGVTGSGNNMPRGESPACAAGAARRRSVMPRIATGAPGSAAKRSRKKAKNTRSRQRYVQRASTKALYRLCRTVPGRVPVSSVRPPGPGRVRASIAVCRILPPRVTVIEIATGVNHGTWERWEDVVMCLAFAKLSRDQVELIPDM